MSKEVTALIIMDGYGISGYSSFNAVKGCDASYIKKYTAEFPSTVIRASEEAVGLPAGQMGNSEVGHLNIGAGRIVYQELTNISNAIKNGSFEKNSELLKAISFAKEHGGAVHLMGLLSDGGVHSHIEHLIALLEILKKQSVKDVFIHCFMDGRDVPPMSGKNYIRQLEKEIKRVGVGTIATIMGRYYAMDRDNRWDRVQKAYNAITNAEGIKFDDAGELIEKSYAEGVTDEFIVPAVSNGYRAGVKNGDSVIFYNFRPDRAREITKAFISKQCDGFERDSKKDICYLCMTQYDATFEDVLVAFKPQVLNNTLGQFLSELGLKQLRIAETEKYAHVTFFFNGGVEKPFPGEDRVLIPSPKVATYDLKPEMSALEVTEKLLELIDQDKYDVIIVNYANPDMVGHTGDYKAACKAVGTVERCVHKVVEKIREKGGRAIVTADHGNAEKMKEKDQPYTAHTLNLVPFIIIDDKRKYIKLADEGRLCDVAPTMLSLMGLPIPKEMTGKSLIKHI